MKKKGRRGEGKGINSRAVIYSLRHVCVVNDLNSTDHLINMLMTSQTFLLILFMVFNQQKDT